MLLCLVEERQLLLRLIEQRLLQQLGPSRTESTSEVENIFIDTKSAAYFIWNFFTHLCILQLHTAKTWVIWFVDGTGILVNKYIKDD